jgi:hypothetical protein
MVAQPERRADAVKAMAGNFFLIIHIGPPPWIGLNIGNKTTGAKGIHQIHR